MELTQSASGAENLSAPSGARLNPLEEARDLVAEYALLEGEIAAPGGIRERRLRHRQRCYRLGCHYHQHPDEFLEFAALPYFDGMHKKPHFTNIMWSVLNHSMQAKGDEPTLQRVSKWGIVFEEFYSEGIRPEDCITVLKDRGGMDFIYEQISASKKAHRQALSGDEGQASEAPEILANRGTSNAFPADLNASQAAESRASGDAVAHSIALNAAAQADEEVQELSASPKRRDRGQHIPVEEHDVPNRYDKKGPLNRIDLTTEVAIRFSPDDVDRILNSAAGIIRYSVIRRDGRGWSHLAGSINQIVARDECRSADSVLRSEDTENVNHEALQPPGIADDEVATEAQIFEALPADSLSQAAHGTSPSATIAAESEATAKPNSKAETPTVLAIAPTAESESKARSNSARDKKTVSAPTVLAPSITGSGKLNRERVVPTVLDNGPIVDCSPKLEELHDLSLPPPTLSSGTKSRQKR